MVRGRAGAVLRIVVTPDSEAIVRNRWTVLDGYFKLDQGYACIDYVGGEGLQIIGGEAGVGARGNDNGVFSMGVDGDEGDTGWFGSPRYAHDFDILGVHEVEEFISKGVFSDAAEHVDGSVAEASGRRWPDLGPCLPRLG